jgi:hypothetical protein
MRRVFSSSGCAAIYNTEPKKLSFFMDSKISELFGFFWLLRLYRKTYKTKE